MPGTFTISIDFELYWGVHDKRTLQQYGRNILGARDAIPQMLEAFERYGIHCTWAIVGFLFFDDKEELLQHLPHERPRYANPVLSPYPLIARIGPTERQDPYHFGLSLVRRIKECPHQEIGTHTFSHYYCLEDGQTRETFRADLEAARRSAARLGITLRSLVFPRNQFSADYLGICREAGIEAVRGNQQFWLFRSNGEADETLIKKTRPAPRPLSAALRLQRRHPGARRPGDRQHPLEFASCCRCRSAPGSLALCVSTASLPP